MRLIKQIAVILAGVVAKQRGGEYPEAKWELEG